MRKQAQDQRQRIAQKCEHEFLALVDSDCNCEVVAIGIVQKIVFKDEGAILLLKPIVLWWARLLRCSLSHCTKGVAKKASLRTALSMIILAVKVCLKLVNNIAEAYLGKILALNWVI